MSLPTRDDVLAAIETGFARTPHPGARFLQGSFDGCEPEEAVAPFRAFADWRRVPSDLLDAQYTALSFLSEGGFRFFLPAWLCADVRGELRTAVPLSHLTMGFTRIAVSKTAAGRAFELAFCGSALLNPRRYGAMTFEDAARHRLSVFCREEAAAIVAFLRYQREADGQLESSRAEIDTALAAFWERRAATAPTMDDLEAHVRSEHEYLRTLGVKEPT